jgi:WD40 repeat protein
VLFDEFLQELFAMTASRFNKTVQEFLQVDEKLKTTALSNVVRLGSFHRSEWIGRLPESEDSRAYVNRTTPPSMMVQDMVYDDILQLVLMGCGHDRKTIFGSNKTRGALKIYRLEALRPSMATRNPTISQSYHEYNVWFAPLVSLDFKEAVTKICWDRKRRCVLVGLINGIIMYYHLQDVESSNCSLVYVGEIDFHQDRLLNLSLDPTSNFYIAASLRGRFTMTDCKDGLILSQLERDRNHSITCFTFNYLDKTGFFGTSSGSILVYDCNKNPPLFVQKLLIKHPNVPNRVQKQNSGKISCIKFLHERKALIGCHWNQVFYFELKLPSAPIVGTVIGASPPPAPTPPPPTAAPAPVPSPGKVVTSIPLIENTLAMFKPIPSQQKSTTNTSNVPVDAYGDPISPPPTPTTNPMPNPGVAGKADPPVPVFYEIKSYFYLQESCYLTVLDSIQNDNYITATTNKGTLLMFRFQAMTEQAALQNPFSSAQVAAQKHASAGIASNAAAAVDQSNTSRAFNKMDADKSKADALASTRAQGWEEMLTAETGELRDWLRARDVEVFSATNRYDLLKCLVTFANRIDSSVTMNTLLAHVRLKELYPRPVILLPLTPAVIAHKEKQLVGNLDPHLNWRCMVMMTEEQLMLFAGADGYLYIYSFNDVFATFSGSDERYVLHQRNLPNLNVTTIDEIKANQKTSRGKRLQKI